MIFMHCFTLLFSVHARCLINCLLGIFALVWTPMSTKLWGFSCFLIRNMFGSLVVYLTHLTPQVLFPQLPFAHTFATLVMHWSIPCFFILACHVYLLLCSTLFCLRIELHFFIHLAPLMHHQHSSFLHLLSFFLLDPFVYSCQKWGKYTLEQYTREFCHFYMTLVHILRGRNSISHAYLQGERYSIVEMHIPKGRRH